MKKRGIGIAAGFYGIGYGNGFPDMGVAYVEVLDDGTAQIQVGAADVGQGSTTTLAQIAAEELGITLADIKMVTADTAVTPDGGTTAATRHTFVTGNAVRLACQEAKKGYMELAAAELNVPVEKLVAQNGLIYDPEHPEKQVKVADMVLKCRFVGKSVTGRGWFKAKTSRIDPETGQGDPYYPYSFGCYAAEVEVDTETGKVDVIKVWAALDVGKAINPRNVEGQIEGGVGMGVGFALTEDFTLVNGKTTLRSMADYIVPTTLDMPEVVPIIVEDPEPTGPWGAKGVGEPAFIPAAPAILNAIYDAVGVRITQMPATPERVLAAIKEKEKVLK